MARAQLYLSDCIDLFKSISLTQLDPKNHILLTIAIGWGMGIWSRQTLKLIPRSFPSRVEGENIFSFRVVEL